MAIISDAPISLTAMANNFKDDDVSRDMLLKTLICQKFITDIKTVTDLGKEQGIEYASNEQGQTWPVYGKAIQERLSRNIPWMLQHYPYDRLSLKPQTPEPVRKTTNYETTNDTYKYFGLTDFVIIDTETTGLKDEDEVVELSVVSNTGDELYHSYFYPTKEVDPGAAKVNHLSKSKLEGNPKLDEAEWKKISAAIDGKCIVGHNIPFDVRLTLQTLAKNGVDVESAKKTLGNIVDTMDIAKKFISSKSYSLNNLTTLIGITREEQHDSTDDCRMTLEFIKRLDDILVVKNEYNFIK